MFDKNDLNDLKIIPTPIRGLEIVSEVDDDDNPDIDHSSEGGWFSRMAKGLGKTANKLSKGLTDIITKSKLDQDMLDELEEVLIAADLGPKTAAKVIEEFSKDRFGKDISEEEIREALADVMADILAPVAFPLKINKPEKGPYVILTCGVNGAGKTTTTGKMAKQYTEELGLSVIIAAADTFRAAAVDQLAVWAKRGGAKIYFKDVGADSASVAFEAYERAVEENTDVLVIDTAGRLQNKKNLMEELKKIVRVLKKKDENLPHSVLLVLDSTTGQNAYSQVETFKKMVDVTGLVVTKLDGSAKGGVLIGLADQFGVPVHAIGVGETVDDLRPFNARDYARSLMGLDS
ncbi:MAG: signal recognition particle-docking protein FtsY [Alphaproteobacteria bacterium]|nr:signal recognition particle-docking protein FtsY [Alphaproteobacteria bacterium]